MEDVLIFCIFVVLVFRLLSAQKSGFACSGYSPLVMIRDLVSNYVPVTLQCLLDVCLVGGQ